MLKKSFQDCVNLSKSGHTLQRRMILRTHNNFMQDFIHNGFII